jgi:hypothetical protein
VAYWAGWVVQVDLTISLLQIAILWLNPGISRLLKVIQGPSTYMLTLLQA